jgi:putative IMPACT (imprinted ancient) family translation regulator
VVVQVWSSDAVFSCQVQDLPLAEGLIMSHRKDVEAALPKMHILSQQEIQRLHIQALLAIDDSLRLIAKRRRVDVVDVEFPPRPFAADPSEDE